MKNSSFLQLIETKNKLKRKFCSLKSNRKIPKTLLNSNFLHNFIIKTFLIKKQLLVVRLPIVEPVGPHLRQMQRQKPPWALGHHRRRCRLRRQVQIPASAMNRICCTMLRIHNSCNSDSFDIPHDLPIVDISAESKCMTL